MFRHGIRAVLQNYPTFPIPLSYWDKWGGAGQLTPTGIKQLYDFGKYFRNYYDSFLNKTYHNSKVYTMSTDYDRALTSAYAFLAGLYEPSSDQQWSTNSRISAWLPIPVHTNNLMNDKV
jgi:lysosomal acid phosphatase